MNTPATDTQDTNDNSGSSSAVFTIHVRKSRMDMLKMKLSKIHFDKQHLNYWANQMLKHFTIIIEGLVGLFTLHFFTIDISSVFAKRAVVAKAIAKRARDEQQAAKDSPKNAEIASLSKEDKMKLLMKKLSENKQYDGNGRLISIDGVPVTEDEEEKTNNV